MPRSDMPQSGRRPIKRLLQTTIATAADDWSVQRFSLLGRFLSDQRDDDGSVLVEVTMRDRQALPASDPILSALHHSDFD